MDTSTIEQSVTVAEGGTSISLGRIDQINGGMQIGQISNYRLVGESHFYELNPDRLEAKSGHTPPRAEELAALLAEQKLLILAGELEDKAESARQIAYCLFRRLEAQGGSPVIRERCRGKDPQRIETAFQEGKTTILLLTEISQSLIAGYGPTKLRHLLAERGGYAIVTTDCTRGQWEITDGTVEARLWQELTWQTYYGRDRLAAYLEQQLFASGLEIPAGLVSEGEDGEPRIGGVPLQRAAETLKSPERILAFMTSLVEERTEPTAEGVEAKLAELAGDAAAIRQWYLQFNDRDQLLVVGLVLLDGLPDDLLFAGLEILVESTWRLTDPLFTQFDYHDLSRFAAYFKQTPIDGGFLRIESGSRKRRFEILQVAWNHQRRRLLATLPALTEMVRVAASEPAAVVPGGGKPDPALIPQVSAAREAAERALSRTKSGSTQLQQAVVESLSLIGLLSVEVVEPYLLDLAAEPVESIQLLVAQALALWREANKEEEFFSLLHRWWLEARNVGNPNSWIARATGLSQDPWAEVRATLALTVGFAAQYDRENRLSPRLRTLLEVVVDDPHPRVREAVWKHALPRTVAWHLCQLEPFLRDRVLISEIFVHAVARGTAEACEMRPDECWPLVEAWWATARADSRQAGRRVVLPREALLATVAGTFGYIRGPEDMPWMASEALVENLRVILTEEGHPFVRRYALHGVTVQTQEAHELAGDVLPDLLGRLTLDDRPQVSALAVRSYLHQRQQLEGGDRKLEIDGRSYSVWTDGTRPLTEIEVLLYNWLSDVDRPVAQQVGVASFAALAATSLEREERRLLAARAASSRQAKNTSFSSEAEVHSLNPFGHLAVLVATLGKDEIRPLLRPLMAQVIVERQHYFKLLTEKLRQAQRSKANGTDPVVPAKEVSARSKMELESKRIELILERWAKVRNQSTQVIAGHLQKAVIFYRWRWALVLLMMLGFLGITKLYVRADRAVVEPLEMLAAKVIPSPDVLLDLMAPLPPGGLAPQKPFPFSYVLTCVRIGEYTSRQRAYRASRLRSSLPDGPPPMPSKDEPIPFIFMDDLEDSTTFPSPGLWAIPKTYILEEFAAPLPPGQWKELKEKVNDSDSDELEIYRFRPSKDVGETPRERAWAWRKSILLTH
jgi:hypothetical protein